MMLSEEDFLKKYNISTEDFDKANITYDELSKIHDDYISKYKEYDDVGANLVRILLRFDGVHSVKYRIKDAEHLIEKIIRKKAENTERVIDINTYQKQIQDIIGIRILHLFKSDWLFIHKQLINTFKQNSKPEANIRKGDVETLFKSNGCKIKIHKAGYRSVHYMIVSEPTLKAYSSEVQVRTIFEEAWSEIDHKVRYPYFTNNDTVNEFLNIFNRLSGSADEMGEFVIILKTELLLNQEALNERQQEIEKLKGQIKNSKLDEKTKIDISGGLDSLGFKTPLSSKSLEDLFRTHYSRDNYFTDLTKIIGDLNIPDPAKDFRKIFDSVNSFARIDENLKTSRTIANLRRLAGDVSDVKSNESKMDSQSKEDIPEPVKFRSTSPPRRKPKKL